MSIVAVGVDSIDIARIEALWRRGGSRFLQRIYSDAELAYCLPRHSPAESLAARFCAKEAVMKCLGTGWSEGLAFRQIEVHREATGSVHIRLHGTAAARAAALCIVRLHVSLTHTATMATAFVVAEA